MVLVPTQYSGWSAATRFPRCQKCPEMPRNAQRTTGSDGDRTHRRVEGDGKQTRRAVRRDEREVDDGRGLVSRQSEPLADPIGVTRDLQATDGDLGRGSTG